MERAAKWNLALDLSRETDHRDKMCTSKQSLPKRNHGDVNVEEQYNCGTYEHPYRKRKRGNADSEDRDSFGTLEHPCLKRKIDDANSENRDNFGTYEHPSQKRKLNDANSEKQDTFGTYENQCRKRKPNDDDNNNNNEDLNHQDTSNLDYDEMERKRLLANCQERARMHKINEALDELRKHLPQQFNLYHRRMSKIRTLRLAMSYIGELAELIRADDIRRFGEYREAVMSNMVAGVAVCAAGPVVGVPVCGAGPVVGVPVCGAGATAPASQTCTPTALLELPTTAVPTPYYPYLREACSGYAAAVESMYRTPDQLQQHQESTVYNPRQLNFGCSSSNNGSILDQIPTTPHQPAKPQPPTSSASHPETILAGNGEICQISTPVKPRTTKQLFKAEGIATTPESMRGGGGLRSEPFASPFLGVRYTAELNSSLASGTGSVFDGLGGEEDVVVRDEGEGGCGLEPGQILPTTTTPGRPCRTLVDLIDEDD